MDGLDKQYCEEKPLCGRHFDLATVGAEVADVEFPKLLDPIDDLPPNTVITHARREGDRVMVRGTASDNGPVKRGLVNDKEARPTRPDFAEWETELDAAAKDPLTLRGHAEDAAGNVEQRPEVRTLP